MTLGDFVHAAFLTFSPGAHGDPWSVDATEPIVSEREYDEWGRVKRIVEAEVGQSPPSRPTTEVFYTQAADVRDMVDPLLRTTQYSVDNLGQLLSVTLPPVGGARSMLFYQYDVAGSRRAVTDPERNVTA